MQIHNNAIVPLSLLAIVLPFTAVNAARPATAPVVETDARFDPDVFPILAWDHLPSQTGSTTAPANGIESMAECGFTIAGFVQPEDLPLCEKAGLKAIVAPKNKSPWAKGGWRTLSDADIDTYVREMVVAARQSPAVVGYYITDEPGTPAFATLAKAVAAVRRHAPGKLAYINLFPGYATIGAPDRSQLGAASFTDYLEQYVREVQPQFLSYDNYMVLYSDDLQNPQTAARYFKDLIEVRRVAIEHRLPFWNIVSSNQIRAFTPPPSPANLLLQAYTTLAAGAHGLSWYTYYGRGYGYAPIDKAGQRTETWGYLKMVNDQIKAIGPAMNRLRSTGVFFTSPPPVAGLPVLPGRVIEAVQVRTSLRQESGSDSPLMIGEFVDEAGTDFVMCVNLSLEHSINIKPKLRRETALTTISAVDRRSLPFNSEQGHWLVPGQGILFRLGPQDSR
ncbi:MAG: hypothetical protein A3G75_09170 [Verrucomicrobia bacterium RIFCSPLOWO2_12_FULL_64_8]|nr:MAG: hypothetical protein A3G75_09170 [Verrucomicrobia bacterium RIFCSPLOWO2_12_FULL_64_8]